MEQLTVNTKSKPRLDSFIIGAMPTLSLGKLNKYLRENKIKVNGKKIALSERLDFGDEVKLYLPIVQQPQYPFLNSKDELDIVFEDSNTLIVQKNAGLVTQDEMNVQCDTLINRVYKYLYNKGEYAPDTCEFPPRLCHRLDTGTSGLVILAKCAESEHLLLDLIEKRKIKKEYVCVTLGIPKPASGTLSGYLIKDQEQGHVQIRDNQCKNGKQIITEYRTICTSGHLALLNVNLVTGRTHQIRAHLASIGCPILGDSKYGNNAANRAYRLRYQALCAYRITFPNLDGTCLEALSNECYVAEKPWYYEQMTEKILR